VKATPTIGACPFFRRQCMLSRLQRRHSLFAIPWGRRIFPLHSTVPTTRRHLHFRRFSVEQPPSIVRTTTPSAIHRGCRLSVTRGQRFFCRSILRTAGPGCGEAVFIRPLQAVYLHWLTLFLNVGFRFRFRAYMRQLVDEDSDASYF